LKRSLKRRREKFADALTNAERTGALWADRSSYGSGAPRCARSIEKDKIPKGKKAGAAGGSPKKGREE